jgi:hypothetical protein
MAPNGEGVDSERVRMLFSSFTIFQT